MPVYYNNKRCKSINYNGGGIKRAFAAGSIRFQSEQQPEVETVFWTGSTGPFPYIHTYRYDDADPEKVKTYYTTNGWHLKDGDIWRNRISLSSYVAFKYISLAYESYARLTIKGSRFGAITEDGRPIIGHPGGWISCGNGYLDFGNVTLRDGELPDAPLKTVKNLVEITLCRKFYEQIKDYIPDSAKVTINDL